MRHVALSLIAGITASSFATIAPILPLEFVERSATSNLEPWISIIFVGTTIGALVAPPLLSRYSFETYGTTRMMSYSMIGMSAMFWFIGHVFILVDAVGLGLCSSSDKDDIITTEEAIITTEEELPSSSSVTVDDYKTYFIVGILICMHTFLGAFFSVVSTGYYSVATLIFANKQSAAISSIETASGIGYIVGPILGSMLYDTLGYRCTYSIVSLGMLILAFVTKMCLSTHLQYEAPSETMIEEEEEEEEDDDVDEEELDRFTKTQFEGIVSYQHSHHVSELDITSTAQCQLQPCISQPPPTIIALLRCPPILIGALTAALLGFINCYFEPLMAIRLEKEFHIGKRGIGLIFSIFNVAFLPAVYLSQYLPSQGRARHQIIAISVMLLPVAVLLMGSNRFLSALILGNILDCVLEGPIVVHLLPWMQEQALVKYPHHKQCVNDMTASIYNTSLGRLVGYSIGPLLASEGFDRTTRLVALLAFFQFILFYFGTRNGNDTISSTSHCQRKNRTLSSPTSSDSSESSSEDYCERKTGTIDLLSSTT
jgi:MFS family permease